MEEGNFFNDNPLSLTERLKVYEAIKDDNPDILYDLVIVRDLIDSHWNFYHIQSIPELLQFSPPAISIAAYFGSSNVFNFLISNNAATNVLDKVYILYFPCLL